MEDNRFLFPLIIVIHCFIFCELFPFNFCHTGKLEVYFVLVLYKLSWTLIVFKFKPMVISLVSKKA